MPVIDGLQVELGPTDNVIARVDFETYLELPESMANVPARFVWTCPVHAVRHVFDTMEALIRFALTWNQAREDYSASCVVGGVL